MPRGDRTGPEGLGAMTGRRMGDCNDNNSRGTSFFAGLGFGRKLGYNRGFGRGFRRFGQIPVSSPKDGVGDESSILKDEIARLKSDLSMMEKRLTEIVED